MSQARWPVVALVVAGIGWLVSVHLSLVGAFVTQDPGAFLTIAAGILDGSLPYADYVDHKPPGIYYTLAAVLVIDHSATAAKVLILAVNLATALLVGYLAFDDWGVLAAVVGVAFYLVAVPLYQGHFVLTGQFLALTSVVAFALLSEPTRERTVAAGVVTGVMLLFKQTAVFTAAGLLVYLVAVRHAGDRTTALGRFVAGTAVPGLLAVGYFTWEGAVEELLFFTVWINVAYGQDAAWLANLAAHLRLAAVIWPLWLAAAIGAAVAIERGRRELPTEVGLTILLATSLVPLVIRPYPHYLLQALPFATLLAAFALDHTGGLLARARSVDAETARVVVAVVLIVSSLPAVAAVQAEQERTGELSLENQRPLATYVQQHTAPDEEILVTGTPAVYFLSDREPITRNLYYLDVNRNVTYTEQRVIEVIQREQPELVVLTQCWRVPEVCEYVRSTGEYRLGREFERNVAVYHRNGTADAGDEPG